MMIAKVFENGRSQAIRLPKEYRFEDDEVMVNKIGEVLIVMPKRSKWDSFIKAAEMFSDDFMEDRNESKVENREEL